MKLLGLHHLAIQVLDLEACVRFYRDVLGLAELTRHQRPDGSVRSVWLGLPGSDGAFLALEACSQAPVKDEFKTERPGFHLLALRISPAHRRQVLQTLAERGIPVVHQSRWTLYVRDPEGNRLGLSHHPEDPEAP